MGGPNLPASPAVLRLSLTGEAVNPQPTLTGQNALLGKSHYFRGNDPAQWRTSVPHYRQIAYQQVYPGIDWVLYGNPRQLEYDFVVAPGADPGLIQMRFSGAESVTLDEQGQLVLKVEGGEVVQHKPLIYQEVNGIRQPIAGGYRLLADQRVGFQVAAYDARQPLVIDPVLGYSTYLGGSSYDYSHAIAVDHAGHAYITGCAHSADFPTVNPLDTSTFTSPSEIFVTKLAADGSALVYSTFMGGTNTGGGVAVIAVPTSPWTAPAKPMSQAMSNPPTFQSSMPSRRPTLDLLTPSSRSWRRMARRWCIPRTWVAVVVNTAMVSPWTAEGMPM